MAEGEYRNRKPGNFDHAYVEDFRESAYLSLLIGAFVLIFVIVFVIADLSLSIIVWALGIHTPFDSTILAIVSAACAAGVIKYILYPAEKEKNKPELGYNHSQEKSFAEGCVTQCLFFFFLIAAMSIYLYIQIRPLDFLGYSIFGLICVGQALIFYLGVSSAMDSWKLDHPKKTRGMQEGEEICVGARP
jgi:hypothetical protein